MFWVTQSSSDQVSREPKCHIQNGPGAIIILRLRSSQTMTHHITQDKWGWVFPAVGHLHLLISVDPHLHFIVSLAVYLKTFDDLILGQVVLLWPRLTWNSLPYYVVQAGLELMTIQLSQLLKHWGYQCEPLSPAWSFEVSLYNQQRTRI